MKTTAKRKNYILRVLSLLLAIMIPMSVIPATPTVVVQAQETSTGVTTTAVNLREGPGTNHKVITVVSSGTSITINDTSNSTWYQITVSGKSGYMHSDYIRVASSAQDGTSATTTTNVNLRESASISGKWIMVVPTGSTITVLDTSTGIYYKVQTSSGIVGYMHSDYIKMSGSAPSTSTPSAGSGYKMATTTYVNLRTGPSIYNSLISSIPTNTQVTVLNDSQTYYQVELASGATGYMHSDYLKAVSDDSTATPSTSYKMATTTYVNLRTGPSIYNSLISTIATNTQVTVLDDSQTYYHVQLPSGTLGYMHSDYLKAVSGGTTATPTPTPTTTPETTTPTTTPTPTPTTTPEITTPSASYGVTTTYVNFRTGASLSSSIISTVATGTGLTIDDESQSPWFKVTINGKTGYMHSDYIKKTATQTDSSAEKTEAYEAKTTTAVNMRTGPSIGYTLVKVVSSGTTLTVTNENTGSDYYEVKLSDGSTGFVHSDYLTKVTAGTTTPETTTPPTSSTTYVKVNSSTGLNFRSGASTSTSIIRVLQNGEVLTVLESVDSSWYKVSDSTGKQGYVHKSYVVSYSPSTSSGTITLSSSSGSVAQYKTYYLKGSNSNGNTLTWSSSNTSVATVSGGFIYGAAPGTATISAKDVYTGKTANFTITVTAAEAVRVAYSETNTPAAGEQFNLIAVTDTAKTSLSFVLSSGTVINATNTGTETQSDSTYGTNQTKIWSAPVTLSEGTHKVKAYVNGDVNQSIEFTVQVFSSELVNGYSTSARRVSDSMLNIICQFEGFVPTVYLDTLANNIPTVGYGDVVYAGETFYNNLTKTEGMAQFRNLVNSGGYTSSVNNLVSSQKLLMNQAQFDALVSFSYNVGSGWTTSSSTTVRSIMLNAVDYTAINPSESNPQPATATRSTTAYTEARTSSGVVSSISQGASVTVVGYYTNEGGTEHWYKIKSSAFSGYAWVRTGYISLNNYVNSTKDMRFVDDASFGFRLLEWHKAGGNCIAGLVYRRLAEAKVFLYSDYAQASPSHAQYRQNTYGFIYPSCVAKYS